ncbi:DUF4349 domain-containing protein [Nocardiopsis baichengensis]|uniref:DUF4349 domain-containing protein n=1 Tax=Nocardiopsis baichengensis TaxID=280240 RepID=UPI00034B5324|nr:DUF4349 domain-containing protein [Nocardiopsis baichengensis]
MAAPSAVALAALLAAGCGAGSTESGGRGAVGPGERGADDGGGPAAGVPEEAGDGEGAQAGQGADGLDVDPAERQVVHTATMTVEADDVEEASARAKELVADAGGHVASERFSPSGTRAPSARLVLKVPQDAYDAALEDLGGLGSRTALEREAEDVTGEVADVDSRVASAESSLDRLRDLLAEADTVEDVLKVESEIADRQAELEALQARQEALSDSTSFGTVELELHAPSGRPADTGDDSIGFLGGLAYGWQALMALADGVAVAAGWLLPFLATAAVVLAPLAWWRRRQGRPAVPVPRRWSRRRDRDEPNGQKERGTAAVGVPGGSGSPGGPGGKGTEGAPEGGEDAPATPERPADDAQEKD